MPAVFNGSARGALLRGAPYLYLYYSTGSPRPTRLVGISTYDLEHVTAYLSHLYFG